MRFFPRCTNCTQIRDWARAALVGSEDQSTMATVAFISGSDFTLAKGTNQAVTPM